MDYQGLSRRRLLGHLGLAGLGVAGLSACDVSTDTGSNEGNEDGPEFKFEDIPDSGAAIPKEDVTLSWVDSGDLKAMFEEPFFAAYQEKYPNVTVDYQPSSWDRINETIPVAVRNNKAPDVFAVPNNVPVQVAVNEGWIQPIDDIVPDFEDWKNGFPEGSFISGVHVFDGKTYTVPLSSSKRSAFLQIMHTPYVEEAGYDPSARLTMSELREACKKITKTGDGEYYGLMIDGDELGPTALEFARLLGLPVMNVDAGVWRGLDHRDGEFKYNSPEVVEAFEVLQAIMSDGSFFPGFMGMDDATARARFPQKVAGIFFDGPWAIPQYQRESPDFVFDVGMPPMGDDKTEHVVPYFELGLNGSFVSANTDVPGVIGDMFHYLGSVEAQANIVVYSQGNLASVIPEANEQASKSTELNDQAVKAVNASNDLLRMAPDARVRNPDAAQVILEFKPVVPTIIEIGEGVFSGDMDLTAELRKLDDASNTAFDKAVKAAQAKGAKVSRDDWVFPGWDPAQDFTSKMYEEL